MRWRHLQWSGLNTPPKKKERENKPKTIEGGYDSLKTNVTEHAVYIRSYGRLFLIAHSKREKAGEGGQVSGWVGRGGLLMGKYYDMAIVWTNWAWRETTSKAEPPRGATPCCSIKSERKNLKKAINCCLISPARTRRHSASLATLGFFFSFPPPPGHILCWWTNGTFEGNVVVFFFVFFFVSLEPQKTRGTLSNKLWKHVGYTVDRNLKSFELYTL